MNTPWSIFFSPPKISNFEHAQRARLLHYMLIAVFIGGFVTGIANYLNGWLVETFVLLLLTVACFVGFYLNHRYQFTASAGIFSISFYVVISLLLYHGTGLYDSTILAFPIFIICVTFLFGTRGLFLATVFSILTIVVIFSLQDGGFLQSSYHPSIMRAITISLLFTVMAMVTGIVYNTWEMNLTLLDQSYDLTLRGWARALEYRDGETAGHSQRVTELSVAVGEAFGLDPEDIRNLRRGSYLHDIGKMAIPDSVLLKPEPLNDLDWKIMKQHPCLGREFLSEIPFLQGAIPVTYAHHERWDGNGYPEGLERENIPLLARIFAVVDNWDALTSDRPYRKAWSDEATILHLKENAGTMFDPKVVEIFLSIICRKARV